MTRPQIEDDLASSPVRGGLRAGGGELRQREVGGAEADLLAKLDQAVQNSRITPTRPRS